MKALIIILAMLAAACIGLIIGYFFICLLHLKKKMEVQTCICDVNQLPGRPKSASVVKIAWPAPCGPGSH